MEFICRTCALNHKRGPEQGGHLGGPNSSRSDALLGFLSQPRVSIIQLITYYWPGKLMIYLTTCVCVCVCEKPQHATHPHLSQVRVGVSLRLRHAHALSMAERRGFRVRVQVFVFRLGPRGLASLQNRYRMYYILPLHLQSNLLHNQLIYRLIFQ